MVNLKRKFEKNHILLKKYFKNSSEVRKYGKLENNFLDSLFESRRDLGKRFKYIKLNDKSVCFVPKFSGNVSVTILKYQYRSFVNFYSDII